MTEPELVLHPDADVLAQAVAARLLTHLVDAQSRRGRASVVLTGGGVGTATLAAVADSPVQAALDWSRVDVWWGDERFLPSGDAERNETGAQDALLTRVPIPAERIHAMPPIDGPDGDDPAAAARRYADELAAAARPGEDGTVPTFDVLMLGVGPDGHVASLFPEQPATGELDRDVVAVHDAPKPPPTRLSLTFRAINAAREVWLVAAGAGKAEAVAAALSGADRTRIPAAGVRGRERTRWLLDRAAASQLPDHGLAH